MAGFDKSITSMKKRYGQNLKDVLMERYGITLDNYKRYVSSGEPSPMAIVEDLRTRYKFITYMGASLCKKDATIENHYVPSKPLVKQFMDERLGKLSYFRTYETVMHIITQEPQSTDKNHVNPYVKLIGHRNGVQEYEIMISARVRAYRRGFQVYFPDCQAHGGSCAHYAALSGYLKQREDVKRVRQVFRADVGKWGIQPPSNPVPDRRAYT